MGQFYTGRTLPSEQDKRYFLPVGSERDYGDGYDPTRILKFVGRIEYQGIVLPKPFAEWLGGRSPVAAELVNILDEEWGGEWRQAN
ncbi:hypothetical protein CSQ96_29120 [Janthinobacterium sp. BJB412]|nr:hypothetical protein CSQ96_29120 [Janthinobacterium sp. BJB412]